MKFRFTNAILLFAIVAGAASAQTATRAIKGDIIAFDGGSLRMKSDTRRETTLRVPGDVRVSMRVPATFDSLQPGVFIGTTATAQPDGTLLASEVHLFPESMRGTGEGHRPMLTVPGSTMSTATVMRVSPG